MSPSQDIAITLGDPAGIGPEIVARAIEECDAAQRARLRILGDRSLLGDALAADVRVDDAGLLGAGDLTPGCPNDATARAQVAYLESAVRAAKAGEIRGLVTAPISKAEVARVGFAFPGHTEFLAQRLGADDVAMAFAGPRLRVVLVTAHLGLAEVGRTLSAELVAKRAVIFVRALMRDFGCVAPRVGVLGFNPHAGEGGIFGDEEARAICPGIELARAALPSSCQLIGPLIPDVAFRTALAEGYDGLVAIYHDQALIPVKLLDFDDTVNVTLGLPIVRTSPDHGTAYDIAGSGRARANSFLAALRLAFDLVDRRERA